MSITCPTCSFRADPGDRFCRGCYTVFESRPMNKARPGRRTGKRKWTLVILFLLLGGTYWIGQLDTSRWAYEEGSIEAAAADLKRRALAAFTTTGSFSPAEVSPAAAAVADSDEAAAVQSGWDRGTLKTAQRRGGRTSTEGTLWSMEDTGANPCPFEQECEAVLRFAPGKIALVRVRQEREGLLSVRTVDEHGEKLLATYDEAMVIRAGRDLQPVEIPLVRADG